MKSVMLQWGKHIVFCVLLVTLLFHSQGLILANEPISSASGTEKLILKKDSSIMLLNGQSIQAVQPVTLKKGVTYAPFSSLAKVYGFQVSYDSKTKESVAKNGDLEIRMKADSSTIKVNGTAVASSGAIYSQKGYTMVPVRTWAKVTESTFTVEGGDLIFTWNTAPKADFSVSPEDIHATQTTVIYKDLSSTYGGRKIIDEIWEGKEDIFYTTGSHTIKRWVMDDEGVWSEPFTVTINVKDPIEPPMANFETDKEEYRLGEPVYYSNTSTAHENVFAKSKWTGNEPAFFVPGEHEVTLEVEDQFGNTDILTKLVKVTDELLYTRDEFYLLFTPVGDKFPIKGNEVLQYESVSYQVETENFPLILSNSPERLLGEEGIAYEDVISGKFYFNSHNMNGSSKDLSVYLIATNPNSTTAMVETRSIGIGGPTLYVSTSGKVAASRFLTSINEQKDKKTVYIPAGESKVIFPELSTLPIKPGLTLTSHAEFYTNKDIRFTVVVMDPQKDPLKELPTLKPLKRDGVHMRATYPEGSRTFHINEQLGFQPQRIVVGDNNMDPYVSGIDGVTGLSELNRGNFGVMYHMKVEVAPNTLIALNARGGHYAGAFLVNGTVVNTTEKSILQHQNEVGVLYRTGDRSETVHLSFPIASGSNLPLNILFKPLTIDREVE